MDRTLPTPRVATCDVTDKMGMTALVVPVCMRDFGGRIDFCGPVKTIKTLDDNSLVRTAVEMPGEGRVLVVDNAGGMRRAVLGGNLAALAAQNGWAGIIINGCVRDSHELVAEDIGIKAIGTCPRKTEKKGVGEFDQPVSLGGVIISTGNWITADADGIVLTADKPSV